jgi:hypothetical protein
MRSDRSPLSYAITYVMTQKSDDLEAFATSIRKNHNQLTEQEDTFLLDLLNYPGHCYRQDPETADRLRFDLFTTFKNNLPPAEFKKILENDSQQVDNSFIAAIKTGSSDFFELFLTTLRNMMAPKFVCNYLLQPNLETASVLHFIANTGNQTILKLYADALVVALGKVNARRIIDQQLKTVDVYGMAPNFRGDAQHPMTIQMKEMYFRGETSNLQVIAQLFNWNETTWAPPANSASLHCTFFASKRYLYQIEAIEESMRPASPTTVTLPTMAKTGT